MVAWSLRWKSVRFLFVECSCMSSVFFRDHLFEGFLCLVHGLLGQFRSCCSFPKNSIWSLLFFYHSFPFFFRYRGSQLDLGIYTGYDYWLAGFIQCRILSMDNWLEGCQPGVS